MNLSQLRPAKGATKNRKRIGRGEGSGQGVTAGRGNKGYRSRSGAKRRAWFEGGQMPLQRRLPKFGFKNINKVVFQVVNVGDLAKIADQETITKEDLLKAGLIRKKNQPVKLLGDGDIDRKISIQVDAVSKSAKEKIEKVGGVVTLT
ncbi:50S ribosomal protein L15 [Caldithrix abyssi]|uniref:Large ribosomal subunit protein uL15 n=1 Tax=Caldithrix abyssi DSM 13497 TaxID=880073 RepID=H1XVY3_CALAY|nr:50S ribosomal protein L15 [Caldithrix abyssi]APF17672.1 rplO LSU ribosomal protein L15P [Caldithrix abyssi DSM 13497]EHO41755.1 ribosomal protein L15 [Caldithrix abyssi DSM 13497]